MGKCVSKQDKFEYVKKKTSIKDNEMDEKSSEFRDNFKLSVNSLKPSDKKIIGKALRKHFLFKQLSKQDLTMIYEKMKLCHLLADEIIYDQNSIGSKFFIIRSGKLEVLKDGKQVRVLSKGDTFGEMALVTMSKRRETVQTLGNTSIWSLSRSSFKQALKFIFSKNFDSNREFISKVRLFSNSADSQKDALTRLAILHEYKEGDVIIREGDEGDLLFIIKVVKSTLFKANKYFFT
jgi:cGMP-dependent protein kinase 1